MPVRATVWKTSWELQDSFHQGLATLMTIARPNPASVSLFMSPLPVHTGLTCALNRTLEATHLVTA